MAEDGDRKTIGASELGHKVLSELVQEGVFREEMDAYRFAIGLGLALRERTLLKTRRTKFNLGSFDKDETVASIVVALIPDAASDPYRAAEELAETGFKRMEAAVATGEFRFGDIFELTMGGTRT